MERLCVTHERDRGLGCVVEMVQSNVGEYVRFEDAQAEIAKLRAERDEAREESAARLRRFCVPHWGDKNGGRCPICERDHVTSEWSRDRNAFIAEKDDLHSHLAAAQKDRDDARAAAIQSDDTASRFRTKAYRLEEQNIILTAALAAARAALDGERAMLDSLVGAVWKEHNDYDDAEFSADVANVLRDYEERRAADAIAVPPNRTGTPEESQAIADWHHDEIQRRAAEAKASRGGEGGA